jgi:HAE1 family hydrophobic/amphiphilic exporter-1
MGTTVIGGMLAATLIAIFLIPVMFYVIERFATRHRDPTDQPAAQQDPQPSA